MQQAVTGCETPKYYYVYTTGILAGEHVKKRMLRQRDMRGIPPPRRSRHRKKRATRRTTRTPNTRVKAEEDKAA